MTASADTANSAPRIRQVGPSWSTLRALLCAGCVASSGIAAGCGVPSSSPPNPPMEGAGARTTGGARAGSSASSPAEPRQPLEGAERGSPPLEFFEEFARDERQQRAADARRERVVAEELERLVQSHTSAGAQSQMLPDPASANRREVAAPAGRRSPQWLLARLPGAIAEQAISRTDVSSGAWEVLGVPAVVAQGLYTSHESGRVTVAIADFGPESDLLARRVQQWRGEPVEPGDDLRYARPCTVRGQPAFERFDAGDFSAGLELIIAGRYRVWATGKNVYGSTLGTLLERIPLADFTP